MEICFEKERTCCFCGHRNLTPQQVPLIARCLNRAILDAVQAGYRCFVCGGVPGFDTLAAYTVLYWNRIYNGELRLFLCLPHPQQNRSFTPRQKEQYAELLRLADGCEYVREDGSMDGLRASNRRMADLSSRCVHYWDGKKSGNTFFMLQYAEKQELDTVDNIYEAVQLKLFFQKRVQDSAK